MDASDQSVLVTLNDGGAVAVDNPASGSYAIRVDVEDGSTIGSVYLELTGAKSVSQTENIAPYSLYGDGGESALSGGTLPVGSYDLQATAYSEGKQSGDELGSLAVSVTAAETPSEPKSEAADLAPSNLVAEIVDDGVPLTWDAPAEDSSSVTGYQIQGTAETPGNPVPCVDTVLTGDTATTYRDTSATKPGNRYAYVVKALRGEDQSKASNQAQVEIPNPLADLAPSNLAAQIVDDGVSLTWDAPAQNAGSVTAYEIERTASPSPPLRPQPPLASTFWTSATTP